MGITDVIVIGSGVAGIAASRKLLEAGLKTVCFEAADRIGGRVNTVPFADGVIDLGAQFCEGEKGNIVYEMANPLGLLDKLQLKNEITILSNGRLISTEELYNFSTKVQAVVKIADKQNQKSIKELIENEITKDNDLNTAPFSRPFLGWYERYNELGGQGDAKLAKSLKGSEERKYCEGDMLTWKNKGFGIILDILMGKYPDSSKEIPLDIQMKKEVDNIKWRSDSKLQVKCKDGSLYEAKAVILTVSVGVLKERHSYLFDPALPQEKINAINNLHMYVLDKIFMEFTAQWWGESPAKINLIWQPEDKTKFTEEEVWITEVYAFETVPYQPNVLVGWINDEGARKMEKASEDDVKKGMAKLLASLFENVTPIKSALRTKWATNRFERGTYSYRSIMTEENDGSAADLGLPVIVDGFPMLCFAGEATSVNHHATVHGAIETGLREAERLIEAFKKQTTKAI